MEVDDAARFLQPAIPAVAAQWPPRNAGVASSRQASAVTDESLPAAQAPRGRELRREGGKKARAASNSSVGSLIDDFESGRAAKRK